jgi:hypothetical protein
MELSFSWIGADFFGFRPETEATRTVGGVGWNQGLMLGLSHISFFSATASFGVPPHPSEPVLRRGYLKNFLRDIPL